MIHAGALLIAAPLLCGCDVLRGVSGGVSVGSQPIVQAMDGASASLTITACPRTIEGGVLVQETLNALASQGTIVRAQDSATAKLVVNVCPFAPIPMPPPAASGAMRR